MPQSVVATKKRDQAPKAEEQPLKPQIVLKREEYAAIKRAADATGTPFSTYVRRVALEKVGAGSAPFTTTRGVELVGTIHAGEGGECREDVQGQIFCSEHPNGDSYSYLEIEGDCMDKVVPPGARALFRRQGWTNGQIVAVRLTWVDGCELALRRLRINDNKEVEFHPESNNPKNKPLVLTIDKSRTGFITLNPENAEIVGVFTGDYIVRGNKK